MCEPRLKPGARRPLAARDRSSRRRLVDPGQPRHKEAESTLWPLWPLWPCGSIRQSDLQELPHRLALPCSLRHRSIPKSENDAEQVCTKSRQQMLKTRKTSNTCFPNRRKQKVKTSPQKTNLKVRKLENGSEHPETFRKESPHQVLRKRRTQKSKPCKSSEQKSWKRNARWELLRTAFLAKPCEEIGTHLAPPPFQPKQPPNTPGFEGKVLKPEMKRTWGEIGSHKIVKVRPLVSAFGSAMVEIAPLVGACALWQAAVFEISWSCSRRPEAPEVVRTMAPGTCLASRGKSADSRSSRD